MHTQQNRFERLTGITLAALLVSAGLLTIEDVNDKDKIDAATVKFKEQAAIETDTELAVKVSAIAALQNGVMLIAGNYSHENFGPKDIEYYARSVAGTKFDFDKLESNGYDKFNPDLIAALKNGQTEGAKGEISDLDVHDIANVVACLDSAFTTMQIMGVPTDVLQRGFAAIGLNTTLDVISEIALNSNEVVEA